MTLDESEQSLGWQEAHSTCQGPEVTAQVGEDTHPGAHTPGGSAQELCVCVGG